MKIVEKIIQSALNINGIPSVMSDIKLSFNEVSSSQGITFSIDVPVEYLHHFNMLFSPTVCDIPFGPPIGELVDIDLNRIQNARNGNYSVPSVRIPLRFARNKRSIKGSGEDFIHNEYNLKRIGYAMRIYSDYKLYKLVDHAGSHFCSFVVHHLETLLQEFVELAFSVNDKITADQQDRLHRKFHFSNEWGGSDVSIVSKGLPGHAISEMIAPTWDELNISNSNRVISNARRYLKEKLCSRHVFAVYYDWCENEMSNIQNAVLIPEYILNNLNDLRDFRKVFVKELTNFTRTEWQHMQAEIKHARRCGY